VNDDAGQRVAVPAAALGVWIEKQRAKLLTILPRATNRRMVTARGRWNNNEMEMDSAQAHHSDPHAYANPPIVETALGLQFDILPKLKNAHLGAFWETLRSEWPKVSDAPALPQEFERFGDDQIWGPLGALKLSLLQDQAVPMRVRAETADGDKMVQVQNGRIFYNWIKSKAGAYPHYFNRKPAFQTVWEAFNGFVKERDLGEPVLNQWEMTYLNHLPQGTVWNSPSDWSGLFTPIAQLSTDMGFVELESFGGERHYIIPPKRGRLHVQLQHGKTAIGPDGKELIILKLTARGPITVEDQQRVFDVDGPLDLGHDIIREGFERLTSDAARDYWRRT